MVYYRITVAHLSSGMVEQTKVYKLWEPYDPELFSIKINRCGNMESPMEFHIATFAQLSGFGLSACANVELH